MQAEINHYKNLTSLIDNAFESYADRPAYTCLGQTLNFAEINEKATQLAAYFQSIDLQPGDRIVIQLPNLIQYPIAMYAALKAGLIVVNTNPLYTPREMLHQFNDSGAKAIVILSDLMPKLESIMAQTSIEQVIVTGATDLLTPDAIADITSGIAFNQAVANGKDLPLNTSNATLDDLAILQYTGGTTGVSKGAQLTHRNLIANALQTAEMLGGHCREQEEILVCPLPLYHIYALLVSMIFYASKGNHSLLIPNPRDLPAFIDSIQPFKFTTFMGLNTLFVGLCNQPEFRDLDFSALKLTLSGGTSLTTTAADLWQQVTDCEICEGYGLSETSPIVALNRPSQQQIGTVGEPLAGTQVEFWDENDKAVADGDAGQLVVKGPQVMKGYWQMPEETKAALTDDGYFKTGDIGIRQSDGKIKIVDRMKDLIIVSGFNVYPNEVEDVLVTHPAVIEAAVIGHPDERSGETVTAYLTTRGSVDEAQIIAFCREHLTSYKVPKSIVFMDELPKSSVGKILRRELRK
ncbi:AMP-binding protein [Thalassotalea mangrovi]|nr:AMP-binding protein [Thalassotalea mangrovi]